MNASAAIRAAQAATRAQIAEARDWIKECVGDPEFVDEAPAQDIVLYVERKYAGGWADFLENSEAAS